MKRITHKLAVLVFALLVVAGTALPVSADGGTGTATPTPTATPKSHGGGNGGGNGGGGVQPMCCGW